MGNILRDQEGIIDIRRARHCRAQVLDFCINLSTLGRDWLGYSVLEHGFVMREEPDIKINVPAKELENTMWISPSSLVLLTKVVTLPKSRIRNICTTERKHLPYVRS